MAGMEESSAGSVVSADGGPVTVTLLDDSAEFFKQGCELMKNEAYETAVDLFTKALEIRIQHFGELALECVTAYHKLGCALLYKVQAETDPLGEKGEHLEEQAGKQQQQTGSSSEGEASKKPEEEDEEEEDEDEQEESGGAADGMVVDDDIGEEDEGDLELAWKMLDIARVIYAKQPERSLDEVDVITALADVSLEKELFPMCFTDYEEALSQLESLVSADNRRIAELCFKISLAKQLDQRPGEAIDYIKRAIAVCELRVEHVKRCGLENSKCNGQSGNGNGNVNEGGEKPAAPSKDKGASDGTTAAESQIKDLALDSEERDELRELEELLSDLRDKEEELKQMATGPSLLEAFKTANPEAAAMVKQVYSSTLGGLATSGDVGPGTIGQSSSSSAPVTNLGVMGRGVKRATLTPIVDDTADKDGQRQQPKKRSVEDVRNGGSSEEPQRDLNGAS